MPALWSAPVAPVTDVLTGADQKAEYESEPSVTSRS
jgi:hypothetical protein